MAIISLNLTKIVKMNNVNTGKFGDAIRKQREEKELPLRKVAAYLDIDQAILRNCYDIT